MKQTAVALIIMMGTFTPSIARAQKVELASGISISRKTYRVPDNEAPFFNFINKSDAQNATDEKFVASMLQLMGDRNKAARVTIDAAWKAFLQQHDPATAAKRFNQAYLLDPQESMIYQGFAEIVAVRFNDFDYADELFSVAAQMKSPSTALRADHGRTMLMAGRPDKAKPLLEKAIQDDPEWATPRSNLAWAVYLTGNPHDACVLALEVKGRDIEYVARDVETLKQKAGCPQ